jgi:hypothetical protein
MKYLCMIDAAGHSLREPLARGHGEPGVHRGMPRAVAALLGMQGDTGPRILRRRLSPTDGPFVETKELLASWRSSSTAESLLP